MNFSGALLGTIFLIVPTMAMSSSNNTVDENLPLAVHMTWSIGDRGYTIDLHYELGSDHDGTLEAEEQTSGGYLLTRGITHLTEEDVGRILMAEKAVDLWKLPSDLPQANEPRVNEKGISTVLICYSSLRLVETQRKLMKAVNRECQEDDGSLAAEAFARELIRTAQRHFPDIGKSELWQNELK